MSIPIILIAVIALSIFDMRELKRKSMAREIVVYAVYMLLAIGLGVWYKMTMFKTSVADLLLRLLNLKGMN